MPPLESIAGFALLSLAVAISPGPSWMYVISATARNGFGGAAAAICGNAVGILCHGLIAAAGLAMLLAYREGVFTAVRIAGAIYLAVLAIQMFRAKPVIAAGSDEAATNGQKIFLTGVMVNVLNPKVLLLMVALLPQFIQLDASGWQVVRLAGLHAVIASLVLTIVAVTLGRAARHALRSEFADKMLRYVSGTVLLGFAGRMLLLENL